MNKIKVEIEKWDNLQETENGGLGFKSTKNPLLDLNFRVGGMRNNVTCDDIQLFKDAMEYDLTYAIKWLFFLRDIREGMGERNTFRELYDVFYTKYPFQALALIDVIAEYGRWDDVVEIAYAGGPSLKEKCYKVIEKQLMSDAATVAHNDNCGISLLAKWLPSINASKTARQRALEIISHLHMTKKDYRKLLSALRAKLGVLEQKTCANKWGEVDYNKVSSNANLRYSAAFMAHDNKRRAEYLAELSKPNSTVKMNATNLTPCEIWHKYGGSISNRHRWGYTAEIVQEDPALEAMWNNLKETGDTGNTMVVVDGSGSMCTCLNGGSIEAIDVSRSLGVYFAERAQGGFKNKLIEFSSNPHFLDISGCPTLKDKMNYMAKFNDCSNTNVASVFRLILQTAVWNKMTQSDMPDRILVISDMEFDCIRSHYAGTDKNTIFDILKKEYENAGFKMPKLVFWNTTSRTNTIPVVENEQGVALISGFSQNLVKMVMSNETDPLKILLETLDAERYAQIGEILNSVQ